MKKNEEKCVWACICQKKAVILRRKIDKDMRNIRLLVALSVCVLCAVCCTLAGCKKDKKSEPSSTPSSTTSSIVGNLPDPEWAVSEDYDMTSSMTVTVSVDLALTYESQVKAAGWEVAAEDKLAAFEGENCIGLATPKEGLFYLYVTAPKSGSAVTLKYYSSKVKNLFVADEALVYSNDANIGTVAAPHTPKWTVK